MSRKYQKWHSKLSVLAVSLWTSLNSCNENWILIFLKYLEIYIFIEIALKDI